MHLYFIRHGQSYVNLPDWDGGFVDTKLTALGQQQAARVAAWVARHIRADAMYSSTMRRAVETAQAINETTGLALTQDDRIREIGNCWPDASAVNVDQNPPEYMDFWASERPFSAISENGETWGDFVTRVGRFMCEVVTRHPAPNDTVLVVCHGGVINAVMDVTFNVGHFRSTDGWIHNTGITHYEYQPPSARQEPWRLHSFNMAYHLLEEDGTLLGYQHIWQT